jgi:hypothetical protein
MMVEIEFGEEKFLLVVNDNHVPVYVSDFFAECLRYEKKRPGNLIQKYFK